MTRAVAQHDARCPEIGPICDERREPPQQHHTTLWLTEIRALAEYGLANGLALQAMVPFRFVGTRTTYTDLAGRPLVLDYVDIHHRNEVLAGPGDAQVLVHAARAFGRVLAGVRGGASVPLGKVQPNPFELGAQGLPHEHVQFGTGTFDPVIGGDLAWKTASWTLSAFGQAQAPLYEGSTGYRAGLRTVAGVVASSGFGWEETSLRLGVTGFREGPERWNGIVPLDDGNQGRVDLYVAPGMTFPIAGEWSASVDVRVRVAGAVVGAQLDAPLVVSVSAGQLVHLEEE